MAQVVVGGIRTIRILFGPLPYEICLLQGSTTEFLIWYCLLTIFFTSFFKFMHICVWKHMRDMNDDLIVKFIVRLAILISIWVPATGFENRKENSRERFCTGILAILKQAGSSRYGKEDPGYLRRCLQMIFSTFFFLNFAKKTQDI